MFKFLKARALDLSSPKSERGASLLEYCLLLSTIVIIASTGISAIGARANSTLDLAQAQLGGELQSGASNPSCVSGAGCRGPGNLDPTGATGGVASHPGGGYLR